MGRNSEASVRYIDRIKLECVICKHDNFWERETLMNTKGMSFFNLDWANKAAKNYICDNCGYVHWFLQK